MENNLNLAALSKKQNEVYLAVKDSHYQSINMAYLLAIFLGFIGGHKFYQKKYLSGVFYLVFSWSLIPLVLTLIDLFLIPKQIRQNNNKVKYKVLIESNPVIINDIRTLLEAENSSHILEIVVKILVLIAIVWLLIATSSLYRQYIDADLAQIEHLVHDIKLGK